MNDCLCEAGHGRNAPPARTLPTAAALRRGVASPEPEIGLTVTTHRNQQRLGDVRAGK